MRAYGSNWRLGILLTCVCFLCFTLFDLCIKAIGPDCPVFEEFSISTGVAVLIILFAGYLRAGPEILKTYHLKLHVFRGLLNVASMACFIYALRLVQLANFYALVFAAPLFVTLMASLIFKDRPGAKRWLATAVGFCGVLIVLRPTASVNIGELCVLVGAILFSADIMFMRHTGQKDNSFAIMIYMMGTSWICVTILMSFNLRLVDTTNLLYLLFAGLLMAIGNFAMVDGYRLATSSLAAPFHYTQLLWGVPFGYFIWHEVPDAYTWLGGAVIVASGLYLLRHEARAETLASVVIPDSE